MPQFSVIIPVYNRYDSVKNAISSVLNQTYSDFELIVVDDGSTDKTASIKDEYLGFLKYIRQDNCGVSAARNSGIKASGSPYIAFLDSDDRWFPQKLEKHKEYINNNPDIKIHQTDEIWIRNSKRINPKAKHLKRAGYIFIDSLRLCLISPSSVVIERELFYIYGNFDTSLPVCEDYDLWLRITMNERVGLISEALTLKYGGHKDQLSGKYWGMDRFRVYSIINLLQNYEDKMSPEYKDGAKSVALKKMRILLEGAKKREKFEYVKKLEEIIRMIIDERYSSRDYRILLETENYS